MAQRFNRSAWLGLPVVFLTACGLGPSAPRDQLPTNIDDAPGTDSTIWDLFDARDDPNTTVEVNKYIWAAALDVLDFLPIETVDPFTGVIVTGFGTAPGSSRAYRATVYVQDPALDARSLRLALATRSGPADPDTVLAVEDAILTRARQLRLQDSRL
ncbi:hypothetical protein Dshi_0044 [Dinoroseobacter shibae DFL 12 = DSM 16493]|uniref:DUF3576 domain-containing protein n=1 Tax=Dinoroseobacter shibae (strain DSM 16493 / NCIMB 14021 / DFL 12) TaxID=398580 RepID=A8LJW7_DINSH|nr:MULTISPECIES: DUF3576 domain-containing protein [Dinoroseobacter]ABV91793.1 hypothetical protein Dshi_0044 [Dinoroseobacter shibae DFL 12 = DSM 16493]MDD9717189.1 DUF3576 domain-containing protein [Dinoroseobacter sp. PD6]URF46775.1 DUF3576 domain-containing protein [Dinoroseobacter shibae]URF51086.1 DUF3576 domain-containing protein [Dinoroseobacter shibae]